MNSPASAPPGNASAAAFLTGLVFGFDVGTGSIGWAVRKGPKFRDVGVLICPEDTSDLSRRRGLRRQRRTLRSRKYRRQWFATDLMKLGVRKPAANSIHDPVRLRIKALQSEELQPEKLHAALAHLFKRRGYTDVPWKDREAGKDDQDKRKELGETKAKKSSLTDEMKTKGCDFPCPLLATRANELLAWQDAAKSGKPLAELWAERGLKGEPPKEMPRQRQEVWPRELLEKEFRAIVAAQAARFPKLAERVDRLLYGDTREVERPDGTHHVFFKTSEGRNPGVLGLRWPRFENRGPAVDSMRPMDEQGRPLHGVRKDQDAFLKAQWELAVMNFRVIDRRIGALVAPDARAMARLRETWESRRRSPKGKAREAANGVAEPKTVEVKVALLEKWVKEFADHYKLVEGQQPLTPQTGAGRARYSSPTLELIRTQLASGLRVDPPPPVLQRPGEITESALNRYLADIKHPLVRHWLVLFRRLVAQLVERFGPPDMIVLEAVRSLALSKPKQRELVQRNQANRDERASIREELAGSRQSTSRNAILRYRLWKEAGSTCPFCWQKISQEELFSGATDIEHLVPRAIADCNEFYNLTVGHIRCNRDIKGDRTPHAAFGQTGMWAQIKDNAGQSEA